MIKELGLFCGDCDQLLCLQQIPFVTIGKLIKAWSIKVNDKAPIDFTGQKVRTQFLFYTMRIAILPNLTALNVYFFIPTLT